MVETVIWKGNVEGLTTPEVIIVCEYEREAGKPMFFNYYVGDRRALESQKPFIDACLVHECLKLSAIYEGVLMPIPEGAKVVIDALRNLGKSWVKGGSK